MNNRYTPSSFLLDEKRLCRFVIPVYQRLFVWSDAEIEQLLSDLWDNFKKDNGNSPYYIGIISVYRKTENNNIWEIVDGQQRLTFLTLFVRKILQWIDGKSDPNGLKQAWNSFLVGENGEMRLYFMARKNDREDILKTDKHENHYFQNFDLTFDRFVKDKIANEHSEDNKLYEFFSYVFAHTTFLVAQLPESYSAKDLNLYFEKMNSTGLQLEQEEIVKGKYFSRHAKKWNLLTDFSKRFIISTAEESDIPEKSLVEILQSAEWMKAERPSRYEEQHINRGIISVPVFLLHSLRMLLKIKAPERLSCYSKKTQELLKTFKECFDCSWTDDFLRIMSEYRQWLDNNIIHRSSDGYFAKPWKSCAEDEEEDQNYNFEEEELQFQAMLTVSSDTNQGWVLEAYEDRNEFNETTRYKYLRRQDWKNHPLFDQPICFGDRGSLYWFRKLEFVLWKKNQKNEIEELAGEFSHYVSNYHFSTVGSEEHLYPQNPDEAFSRIAEWENGSDGDDERDRFGNLALLSDSFNSSQSNSGIKEKFGAVTDRMKRGGKLESIKYLLMLIIANPNDRDISWTPEIAKQHRENMERLLREDHDSVVGNNNKA